MQKAKIGFNCLFRMSLFMVDFLIKLAYYGISVCMWQGHSIVNAVYEARQT